MGLIRGHGPHRGSCRHGNPGVKPRLPPFQTLPEKLAVNRRIA
jgi:hypothetical protein